MVQFKTLARRDAFERMDHELKLLFETVPEDRKEVRSSCTKVIVKKMTVYDLWLIMNGRPAHLFGLQLVELVGACVRDILSIKRFLTRFILSSKLKRSRLVNKRY